MTRVLGVDASLTATGLAAQAGTWTVTYPRGVTGDLRLAVIYRAVFDAAEDVELAAVEDLPPHLPGAKALGLVQGVVRLALIHQHVPYVVVPPSCLKVLATGKGSATKPDLRMAYYLATAEDQRDDNQVDAFYLRQLALAHYGLEGIALTARQRTGLDGVDWTPAPEPVA